MAMVDIPIGLPASGNRECDVQAKKLLKQGGSRVFTGARRGYWNFKDRLTGHQHYKSKNDKGISCQLWCIGAKIKEVDDFMKPERQRSLRETHPELVFLRLNGWQALPGKKSKDGIQVRREILKRFGFEQIDEWVDKTRIGKGAAADDVLDACACAIAASNPDPRRRIPEGEPPTDSKGLRMEMWY
jgi:predicted RNase H-like nuclease